ncbi:hypothetical protein [Providencia sp. PROV144]|uniref:hypothetical protein n=1 Tax=Providencia sp. PROV144 TaxID=2949854 RepID=UPI00234A80E3|nr:hypothetical protein [Providencia sp. PROV144]
MSLKSSLLKPNPHVESHTILNTTVFIRRLTIAEIDEYELELRQAQETGLSSEASKAGARLILKAICDEKGKPYPPKELPTDDELIKAHDIVFIVRRFISTSITIEGTGAYRAIYLIVVLH